MRFIFIKWVFFLVLASFFVIFISSLKANQVFDTELKKCLLGPSKLASKYGQNVLGCNFIDSSMGLSSIADGAADNANELDPLADTKEFKKYSKKREGLNVPRPKNDRSVKISKLTLSEPQMKGNACPRNSTKIVLSPDQKNISILWDQFNSAGALNSGSDKNERQCEILIPFRFEGKYRMQLVQLDLRGFASLNDQSKIKIVSKARWLGRPGIGGKMGPPSIRKVEWAGSYEDDFIISSEINNLLSPCGEQFVLKLNTRVVLHDKNSATRRSEPSSTFSLDSIDSRLENSTKYHLLWESCL